MWRPSHRTVLVTGTPHRHAGGARASADVLDEVSPADHQRNHSRGRCPCVHRRTPALGRAILATGAVIAAACASVLFAAPANAATGARCVAWRCATCNGLPVTITGTNGPDTITGTNSNNVIAAGCAGNDVVSGFGGNDTVCLGAGNNQFDGGPGNDTVFAQAAPDEQRHRHRGWLDTVNYSARTTPVNVSL